MCKRWMLAVTAAVVSVPSLQAQFPGQFSGPIDPRLADLKLPLAELSKVMPGGMNQLPPLPGMPLGGYMPPPGTNFLTGKHDGLMNAWGAQTPWPFQNPFTPAHWNYAGMGNGGMNYGGMNYGGSNPWANNGMWAAPPFGQYGFGGYGNFAPIVGANNGWWPYDAGMNNGFGFGGNPWNMQGYGSGLGTNPMAPNNLMFQRVP